jgi:hypothetical protein
LPLHVDDWLVRMAGDGGALFCGEGGCLFTPPPFKAPFDATAATAVPVFVVPLAVEDVATNRAFPLTTMVGGGFLPPMRGTASAENGILFIFIIYLFLQIYIVHLDDFFIFYCLLIIYSI